MVDAQKPKDAEPSRQTGGAGAAQRAPLRLGTAIATFAPGLVVVALPTIGLIARNQEAFSGDFTAGRDMYILALGVIAVGFGLWAASGRWPGRFMWICYLLLTPGWLVYTWLGSWNRTFAGALVGASIVAIASFAVQPDRLKSIRGIGMVSVFILVGFVVTTLFEAAAANIEEPSRAAAGTPTNSTSTKPTAQLPNVYHVVLDEFQTDMFELSLDDDLREELSAFTYFPQTHTMYGRTEMSMASILGPTDYRYEISPQDYVDASLRGDDSSLNDLRQAGYRITGLFHLPSLYGSPSPFDESVLLRDYVEFEPTSDTELANSLWLFSNAPTQVARHLVPEDRLSALSAENLLPSDAPAMSALSLAEFIAREPSLPDSGRYTLIHLILPHFPYVMTADCRYTEGVVTSPTEQTSCANRLIVDLVQQLRELDRFDSSVVVVHGDHGARFEANGKGLRQLPQDFESEKWNEARSRSLLLVKPAGADPSRKLEVSAFPALLTDVMATIFDSIDVPFAPRDGRVSLLDDDLPDRPTRLYHFYDKGDDGLPDGELTRFLIGLDDFRFDRTIRLPD